MTLSAAPTTSARRPRAASRVGVVGGRAHTRRINLHMDVTGAAGERERQRGKKQTDGTPMLPPPPPPPPPLEIELVVAFSSSGWGRGGEGKEGGGENDLDVPRIGHWRRDNAVFVSTGCDCSRRDTERTVECGMIRWFGGYGWRRGGIRVLLVA